jgi:hypothetical protein
MIYAHFDGDDVGPKLELMLLDNKLEEARTYSRNLTCALEYACRLLQSLGEVDVIAAGGDDLIVGWIPGVVNEIDIERVRVGFFEKCGCTLSAGIGVELSEAAGNLHRAKLLGKNRVISTAPSLP